MSTAFSILLVLCFLCYLKSSALECPALTVNSSVSHLELIYSLTHPCRYDSTVRPDTSHLGPLKVRARVYVYHLQLTHSINVEFKVMMLVQLHWLDKRLAYKHLTDVKELVGHGPIGKRVWSPHILMSNEQKSKGTRVNDDIYSFMPDGEVYASFRMQSHLLCQYKEGHFPFDDQICQLIMDNWRYNVSFVELLWEDKRSVLMPPTFSMLPEFNFKSIATTTAHNLTGFNTGFLFGADYCDSWSENIYGRSNDSFCDTPKNSLVVSFHFARKFGFYFWNYYVPSVMLVVISWWTFWIDPEVIPARVWLATCTMLGLFGLGAMSDALPKLSQLKMNDIWFIGCSLFILLSLAEFAFVNLVHRQEKKFIPLKKASSKYILKSSLRTETLPWKQKAASCPSSPELRRQRKTTRATKRKQQKSVAFNAAIEELTSDPKTKKLLMRRRQAFTGTHMTNVEMANWIDRRSRAVFPLAFLFFNFVFWSLMFV